MKLQLYFLDNLLKVKTEKEKLEKEKRLLEEKKQKELEEEKKEQLAQKKQADTIQQSVPKAKGKAACLLRSETFSQLCFYLIEIFS